MELLNAVSKYAREGDGARRDIFDEAIDTMLLLLAPMSPHLTSEMWEERHGEGQFVHAQSWPVADPELLVDEDVVMVIQVAGKVRARATVATTISEDEAIAVALAQPEVQALLNGAAPSRVVARAPKLVNIVP
jgi:leucyl-tRNA synthetase